MCPKRAILFIIIAMFLILFCIPLIYRENFGYFPWNEANIVFKEHPESSVPECDNITRNYDYDVILPYRNNPDELDY